MFIMGASREAGGGLRDITWHVSRAPFSPKDLGDNVDWMPGFPNTNPYVGLVNNQILNIPPLTAGFVICQYG